MSKDKPEVRLWNHDLSAYQKLPSNWRVVSIPPPRPVEEVSSGGES